VKRSPNPHPKVQPFPPQDESIPFQAWFHRELENDEVFRSRVEQRLAELELERQLVEKRQALGLNQAQFARYARLGQPYLARLEAGVLKNVELKTLVKAATALGCKLRIIFEEPRDHPRPLKVRVRSR
jgi:hypothetical protein